MDKSTNDFWSCIGDYQRKEVETLLKAQAEGLRVSVEEGGVLEETTGMVSDVRIENGDLVFKLNGEDYRPLYGISVTILGKHIEIREPSEILQNASYQRKEVETLLKAQEEALRVSVEEGGVCGETTGMVSDVRIENGDLVFKLNGKDYRPFYGITVTSLGKDSVIRP